MHQIVRKHALVLPLAGEYLRYRSHSDSISSNKQPAVYVDVPHYPAVAGKDSQQKV